MRYLNSSVMSGVTDNGLVFVTQNHGLSVEIPTQNARLTLLETLVKGFDKMPRIGGLSRLESDSLMHALEEVGALATHSPDPAHPGVIPLADAVRIFQAGGNLARLVTTAEELLVTPKGIVRQGQQRILRAFIAGITPHERLTAYANQVLSKSRVAFGDYPNQESLDRALSRISAQDAEQVHVLRYEDLSVESYAPQSVLRGWRKAGRLRPVRNAWERASPELSALKVHVHLSEYACPNLLFASGHDESVCKGVGTTATEARIRALAEATERFASGEIAERSLKRASEANLRGGFCRASEIIRYNPRQYEDHPLEPYNPEAEYLWIAGKNTSGVQQWIPAELVFYPFHDPIRSSALAYANSSGVAAHTSMLAAIESACRELVERDAYMWTWIQRISRERIATTSLPDQCQRWISRLKTKGYETDFVNLSLDSHPVILCAVHNSHTLTLGAACHANPVNAVNKALEEAASLLWSNHPEPRGALRKEEVHSTTDHQRLYCESPLVEEATFLYSSSDHINLQDIASGPGSILDAVSHINQPIIVDLSGPHSGMLKVMRVLVPGMVPISFGYDLEPLGMERLNSPIETTDGRVQGTHLELLDANPMTPHPFA